MAHVRLKLFCRFQGYPGTESTFCGRAIRDLRPIKVSKSMSMEELKGLFVQEPVDPSSFRSLIPDISYTPQARMQVPLNNSERKTLQEMYLHFGIDDCESSALTAQNLKQTSLHLHRLLGACRGNERWQKLKSLCQGWQIFRAFTDQSWQAMCRYLDRGNTMLASNQLRVINTTGLSSTAKAGESADSASYCGHCFNVCTVQTPSMAKMHVGVLEGTSHLYMLPVNESSPRVTTHLKDPKTGKLTTKIMNMPEFLTTLCSVMMRSTLVINKPNGDVPKDFKGGWPLDVEITGWLARTMVMCTLDSDPSTPLSFYNRVMYMSWPCTLEGQGCMPVTEIGHSMAAGCHPFKLVNSDIRGVNAALDEQALERMKAVMDEATPPMVRESVVQDLASKWIPCQPLETINMDAKRESGVQYNRVSFMESPCAPEYVAIIYEAKRRVAEEVNRINDAKPNSDGIRFYALLEGLSAVLCADVPYRDISALTIGESLETALQNIKYPGAAKK